jgi:hypothetical protein
MDIATTDGFLTWFSQWGQVIYILTQMVFWVAIAAAALIVATQYRRFVTHKVGDATPTRRARGSGDTASRGGGSAG